MSGLSEFFSSPIIIVLAITATTIISGAGAVADEGVGRSGGKLADVPGGHIEFLGGPADALVMFNVTNAKGRAVELEDAIASAFLNSKHRAEKIRLTVVEPGWLAGEPSSPPEPGSDVTVTIEWSDGRRMQSSFAVK
jgi:hypothetical protein